MNIRLTWKIFFAFWGALWLATGLPMVFLILFGNFPNPEQVRDDRFAAAHDPGISVMPPRDELPSDCT